MSFTGSKRLKIESPSIRAVAVIHGFFSRKNKFPVGDEMFK